MLKIQIKAGAADDGTGRRKAKEKVEVKVEVKMARTWGGGVMGGEEWWDSGGEFDVRSVNVRTNPVVSGGRLGFEFEFDARDKMRYLR